MKIEVILDKDNYIESYTLISEGGYLNNSTVVDIEDIKTENDLQGFEYTYDCYKIENDKVVFDDGKLLQIITEKQPLTKEQELEKRIIELENIINLLVNKGLVQTNPF